MCTHLKFEVVVENAVQRADAVNDAVPDGSATPRAASHFQHRLTAATD